MKFLRTASTRRLLGVLAGLVAAIAATTAIAVAASGSGPVPKAQPLANAVHQALGAKGVTGITADITFTNHLIDASALQSTDPVLSGATGRLWLSDNHQLRLELQSNNGDAEVLVDHKRFWISDPAANTVYEGTLPSDMMASGKGSQGGNGSQGDAGSTGDQGHGIPSVAKIQSELTKLMQHVDLSGATPTDVGGQPAYSVSVSPKHDGGLLGSVALAWDAVRGVPLRFAVYAKGNPDPVIELTANDISYGAVPASDFAITPPSGAKVVSIGGAQDASTHGPATPGETAGKGHHHVVTGLDAVKAKLSFPLAAPDSLVGLPRRTVSSVSYGGSPAALVTYGQGLGGIAVIERAHPNGAATKARTGAKASRSAGSSQGSDSGQSALSLPTVSINGATGQELDTALGTLVTFTRGGVDYTIVGSVPSAAADAAARGL